jgi:cobalamin biosynthesis protein CobD/CbiB
MAGALGVRLEKLGHYRLAAESPVADVAAIDHAIQVVIAATALALPALLCLACADEWLRCWQWYRGVADGERGP